jgi:hypothetical protein
MKKLTKLLEQKINVFGPVCDCGSGSKCFLLKNASK